ncbi:MAG: hypothetical protein ACLFU7_12670 [Armatimonadota bacterium]
MTHRELTALDIEFILSTISVTALILTIIGLFLRDWLQARSASE